MKRRHFVLGTAALAGGGAIALRPENNGAPYEDYFRVLNQELKANGPMRPSLIVDLDRLDHNIDQVMASLGTVPGRHYRIVEKSLPSVKLLDYVSRRSGSQRFMSFHQPFLNTDARTWPDADLLLGKPMPVRAAQTFYAKHQGAFDPSRQLQWLIDTPARLKQYLDLARAQQLHMRINIELDVGLHRGGVEAGIDLARMLKTISAHPEYLSFAGFMGYDPHVPAVPRVFGTRGDLFDKAMGRYEAAVALLREHNANLITDDLTFNAAGSPTYRLHEAESLATELSVGTGLLKPSHYDMDTLSTHQPAVFIATPVLKSTGPMQMPGLDEKSRLLSWWDVNQSETFFMYGGNWPADYAAPQGLQFNALYGHSSNQEIVNASSAVALRVDDQIFLRPHITEAVLLQFGDLIAVRGGRIVDYWPVFNQTG